MLEKSAVRLGFGAAVSLGVAIAGCGGDGGSNASGGAGGTASGGAGGGASGGAAGGTCKSPSVQPGAHASTSDDWCRLDQVLDAAYTGKDSDLLAPGYSLQVYTVSATGELALQYERYAGTAPSPLPSGGDQAMTPDTPVLIASATKYLTGITALRAMQVLREKTGSSALLSLDSPLSDLGCSGIPTEAGATQLRAVMHQIAGLRPEDSTCLGSGGSIQSCACEILGAYGGGGSARFDSAAVGKFAYGSPNFTVIAAMVEHALAKGGIDDNGKPMGWKAWFDRFAVELGTDDQHIRYATAGDQSLAGGVATTGAAYAKFLALAAPGATKLDGAGQPFVDPADVAEMATPFGDSVEIVVSPYAQFTGADKYPVPFRYGLASWVMCTNVWPTPDTWAADPPNGDYSFLQVDYATCSKKILHSEGKFGFYPWVSFATEGASNAHIAVLATNKSKLDPTGGKVSQQSFDAFAEIEVYLDRVLR